MPTVAVSLVQTPPLSSLGASHISPSKILLQECRDPGISLSPRQVKRRPAVATMESEDEDHSVGSKPTIHSQKRQKSTKSRPIDEAFSTAGRDKAFRNLQEQREQLPIARGGTIHEST
jgi:hypothetical protein